MALAIFGDFGSWLRNRYIFRHLPSITHGIIKVGSIFVGFRRYLWYLENQFSVRRRASAKWIVYKYCSGEVYCYIFIANITVNVWSKCDFSIYTWYLHGAKIRPTIGDKIVDTLYTNRVTSENKRIRAPPLPPPPPHSKLGCSLFSIGSSNISTTLHWGDGGGKARFPPFEVSKM